MAKASEAKSAAPAAEQTEPRAQYYWWWKSRLAERRGQPCLITARGKMNTIRVEFLDGFIVFTSRYAVRREM